MNEHIQQLSASQDLLQVIVCLMATSFMLGGLVAILIMMAIDMFRRAKEASVGE